MLIETTTIAASWVTLINFRSFPVICVETHNTKLLSITAYQLSREFVIFQ